MTDDKSFGQGSDTGGSSDWESNAAAKGAGGDQGGGKGSEMSDEEWERNKAAKEASAGSEASSGGGYGSKGQSADGGTQDGGKD